MTPAEPTPETRNPPEFLVCLTAASGVRYYVGEPAATFRPALDAARARAWDMIRCWLTPSLYQADSFSDLEAAALVLAMQDGEGEYMDGGFISAEVVERPQLYRLGEVTCCIRITGDGGTRYYLGGEALEPARAGNFDAVRRHVRIHPSAVVRPMSQADAAALAILIIDSGTTCAVAIQELA